LLKGLCGVESADVYRKVGDNKELLELLVTVSGYRQKQRERPSDKERSVPPHHLSPGGKSGGKGYFHMYYRPQVAQTSSGTEETRHGLPCVAVSAVPLVVASSEDVETGAPSCSDTGAQNTGGADLAFIDWLSFTFPVGATVEQVLSVLGSEGWMLMPSGRFGYRGHYRRGNVSVLFDGSADMGVHVDISGKGCREIEGAAWFPGWQEWLGWLLEFEEVSVTRLDLAFDDHDLILSMDEIRQSLLDGRIVSRWKTGRYMQEVGISTGGVESDTVYLGSRSSDTMLRLYDKGKQLGTESFVRCELETKRKKAQQAARLVVERGMSVFAAVLSSLVDFKASEQKDVNRSRWQTASWWARFVGAVEKVRLSVAPAVRTVEEVYEWFCRQVAPSLAVIFTVFGGDLDALTGIINHGRSRWKDKHRLLLSPI